MKTILAVEWISSTGGAPLPGHLRILDQTRLPGEVVFIDTTDINEVWHAIKTLQVRGAPAIGVAAALGIAAAAQRHTGAKANEFRRTIAGYCDHLATSRPTAVNLFYALDRMRARLAACGEESSGRLAAALLDEAMAIRNEDATMCSMIGHHGATLLSDGMTVLTHCNAGRLATSDYGTALAPVYTAVEQGMDIRVYADETRPLLQGARLTAWELASAGIDVTLICDNTAAWAMRQGRIDIVFAGADRIAANGDTANKVGTYGVAVLARRHNIPFYILAPTSTFDLETPDGDGIPIEERAPEEVTCPFGTRIAPDGIKVFSPAFDVTPAELITGIICEKGIIKADRTEIAKASCQPAGQIG